MKSKNIVEAEMLLQKYIPNVANYGADNQAASRVSSLLILAGNSHEKLKIIHVAGTSGKTSTCYYIANLLQSSGKKVGLAVSPHVYSVSERVQINCSPISDEKFLKYLKEFIGIVDNSNINPSYFELLLAFTFWVFYLEKVDYAVIETGMGGLHDGTNVCRRNDKICVITDIGYDHMQVLGKTIPEIASQKAGIIHDFNTVFMYKQSNDVTVPIKTRITQKNAKLYEISNSMDLIATKSQLPDFQKRNYHLSKAVYEYIVNRDNLRATEFDPLQVKIPGRIETINLNENSTLVFDGAHNEQKIKAFVNSFRVLYPNEKAVIMLALKKGKEYKGVIQQLNPIVSRIIITKFDSSECLPAVSQDTSEINSFCQLMNIDSVVIDDNKKASKELIDSNSRLKVVTGSFYLIGQVRDFFRKT
jgi:dihydrofolate synthase/folylpolyglutamate synthase